MTLCNKSDQTWSSVTPTSAQGPLENAMKIIILLYSYLSKSLAGSKLFDTLLEFLKEFIANVNFEKTTTDILKKNNIEIILYVSYLFYNVCMFMTCTPVRGSNY